MYRHMAAHALGQIAAGSAACAQAVVDAGGAVGVVAALRAHVGDKGVQNDGCILLGQIAAGGAACAQAVVEAGRVQWQSWRRCGRMWEM